MKTTSDNFRLHFSTSADLPPPFANKIEIEALKTAEGLQCSYSFVYTGREGFTPEDLAEEGFSEQDDRAGEALLLPLWTDALENFLDRCSQTDRRPQTGFYALTGDKIRTFPGEKAAYFLHELIQAVNEESRVEKELIVRIADISKQKEFFADFTLSFARRLFSAEIHKKNEIEKHFFDWAQGTEFVRLAFDFEYVAELGREGEPRKRGFYISPDNGIWYQAGKAVFPLDGSDDNSPFFREHCFKLLKIN